MNRLSGSVLRIIRSGPNEENFSIVDVPGLVRGVCRIFFYWSCNTLILGRRWYRRRAHNRRRPYQVVSHYSRKHCCVTWFGFSKLLAKRFSAVIDMAEIEHQEIFQLLKDMPDQELRVIGVVNKCDIKQTKSSDWVCDPLHSPFKRSSGSRYLTWYEMSQHIQ